MVIRFLSRNLMQQLIIIIKVQFNLVYRVSSCPLNYFHGMYDLMFLAFSCLHIGQWPDSCSHSIRLDRINAYSHYNCGFSYKYI